MRVQTLFGRTLSAAHEPLLGAGFVLLRIAFALECLRFGKTLLKIHGSSPLAATEPWFALMKLLTEHESLLLPLGILLVISGVMFLLGLFTRPAAVLVFGVLLTIDIFVLGTSGVRPYIPLEAGVVAFILLAITGGMGHAAGLNGLILRNIRHPQMVARALFG